VIVPPSVPDNDFHPYINAGAQAVDDAGNVYVAGLWRGGDLQFGTPAVATLPGVVDDRPSSSFVAKYTPQGGLLWSKAFEPRSLGGYAGNSSIAAIALDGQGGLYVTGTYSNSVDFDPGPGEAVLDQMASMYLLRLTSGGDLDWVHNLGEFGSDGDVGASLLNEPTGMVVGDSGLVYITGRFAGSTVDFDPGPGVAQLSSNSNWGSPFIVQYHPDGSLGWAREVTGAANATVATPAEIAAVPGGGVAVAGSFRGPFDFDPGPAVDIRTSNPEGAAFPADALFVMRLDAAGGLVWANTLLQPSNQGDNLNGYGVKALAVDGPGNVYMGGTLDVQLDFDPGLYQYGGAWIYAVGAALALGAAGGLLTLSSDPDVYLEAPELFGRFYVTARLLSLVSGGLLLVAAVRIGRRLGGPWCGPLSAALVMLCPVFLTMSLEAKPHLPSAARS